MRMGSKRIPKKNIRLLNGKPLFAYIIEAAIASKQFDEIYINSEDQVYNDEYYDVVTKKSELYEANQDRITTCAQARSDIHDQPSQIRFFKELFAKDKRIRVDQYLTDNL